MVKTKKSLSAKNKISKDSKVVKKTTDLTLSVYDINGKKTKDLDLPKEIFSITAKPRLLAQAIRVYLSNKRQGTASTKTRGEVSGSTRKIYRQKGTGRARHGSIKAPIFVGGGVVGGPKPRDYSLKLTKKQRRKALFAALTLKLKEKSIFVFDDSILEVKPKTKNIISLLKTLNFDNKKITFVLPKMEKNNFVLASRNLEDISFIDSLSLNTYEVLKSELLIFFEKSIEVFKKHFLKNEN